MNLGGVGLAVRGDGGAVVRVWVWVVRAQAGVGVGVSLEVSILFWVGLRAK